VIAVMSFLGVVLAAVALILALTDHFTLRRKALESQQQAEELLARLHHQGRITSEVAHELKNPITAVVCAAETLELLLDDQIDESHRDTLRYIRDYGEHVLAIMGDFIDVSRGVCGEYPSNKEFVSVHSTVESVIGLLAPTAGRRGVSVTLLSSESEFDVFADPKHLKQILFNLLHNGVKYARHDGNVWVHVNLSSAEDHVIITVRDDGEGIPQSVISRILDKESSTYHPLRSEGEGSGIGLLLTKNLVDLEGGVWDILSEQGRGTAIAVSFTGRRSTPTEIPQEQTFEDSQPFAGRSVLLVDSDFGTRESVRHLIEALGGVVDGVSAATQAVEAIRNRSYSAVLIDEDLVKGSTQALSNLLKGNPNVPMGKLVVAARDSVSNELSADPNVDSVIEKPLSKRALLNSLLPSH
jgi:signal transduction histidine kinase/CheY-like chemotaxis protein